MPILKISKMLVFTSQPHASRLQLGKVLPLRYTSGQNTKSLPIAFEIDDWQTRLESRFVN